MFGIFLTLPIDKHLIMDRQWMEFFFIVTCVFGGLALIIIPVALRSDIISNHRITTKDSDSRPLLNRKLGFSDWFRHWLGTWKTAWRANRIQKKLFDSIIPSQTTHCPCFGLFSLVQTNSGGSLLGLVQPNSGASWNSEWRNSSYLQTMSWWYLW